MGLQLSKHEVHWVVGFETVQMCFNINKFWFLLNSVTACNNTHLMVVILLQRLELNLNLILSSCEFSSTFELKSWCTGTILLMEKFSPHHCHGSTGTIWLELALVLVSLTIWILDSLSLTHIVKIRMNSLPVLFQDGTSSSCNIAKYKLA